MTCLAGRASRLVISRVGSSWPQSGDGELPQGARVVRQLGGGVVDHADGAGLAAGAGHGHRGPGLGGQRLQGGGELGGAGAQGDEPDPALGQGGELVLGGDLGVHDEQVRVVAGDGVPVVGEGHHFSCLGGLGEVGVGVEQGVAVGVLGEEGQHAAGALGP